MRKNNQTKTYKIYVYCYHLTKKIFHGGKGIKSSKNIDGPIEQHLDGMIERHAVTYSWEYAKGTSQLYWELLAPDIYIMTVPGEWFYIITAQELDEKIILDLLKNEKKYSPKA